MEPAVSGASWSSFGPAMPVEESELMAQLLGAYPFLNEQDHDPNMGIPSMFWSDNAADLYNSSQDVNSSLYYWPQENSSSISTSCFSLPSTDYRGCYLGESNVVPEISGTSLPMDFCMVEDQIPAPSLHVVPSDFFRDHICLNEERSDDMNHLEPVVLHEQKPQPKRKSHSDEDDQAAVHEKLDIAMAVNPKKKARAPSQVQRSSKNTKSKKSQKSASVEEDESNAALNGQSSSCYSSEDDSIASQEQSRGGNTASSSSKEAVALNLNGKTRAGRGSATDPQSLYARKRRERINERLKILQNLVPNGTKVDISTMLEEAVEYVKFLQLQIKLLSSDELWMYAPIAYNGMNIGLDLNLIPRKQ